MAFAQGSRSSLSIGVQSDFTTVATGNYNNLPFKTHSLTLSKERLEGQDIQSDRMPRVDRHGNKSVSGSVEVDMRMASYDSLLESLMLSSFATDDTITVGTTPKYLSIEDAANDISQFRLFSGLVVSSGSFSIAPNQMIQTTFDMIGRTMAQSGSSSGGTIVADPGNAPFDSYNGSIFEGGVASGDEIATVTSIDFSVTNSFAPTFVVGSDIAPQLEYGRAVIEGTMTVYYEDAALINKFINETESSIQVSVAEPGGSNPYTFLLPRVKYNGAEVPVANPQSRTVQLPFVSLYDSTEGTNLKITRST
jgi:hypothetical protein